MNIQKYLISELKDRVLVDLGLILFEDLYKLLGLSDAQSVKNFKYIITQALNEYSNIRPVLLSTMLTSNTEFTFIDNFDDYLKGNIKSDEIILVPLGISRIGLSFTSASYWRYSRPKLMPKFKYSVWANRICHYFAKHPAKLDISPDNEFTEDSAIYIMDNDYNEDFLYFLNLKVAEFLRRMSTSVTLSLPVEFNTNLDQVISEYNEKVDMVKGTSAVLLDMWRK